MPRYDIIKLIIKKDPNYKDYVVKFYENDEFKSNKSLHSDTLSGAISTMHKIAMNERDKGSFVIEDKDY